MSASVKETVVIKKYANRRLYNTATSTYVTLQNLAEMVKEGVEFNVYDAKSNEDLTRAVLTQIIVEEEGKSGQNLLPIGFLRRLIGFYGDNMQWLVPKYLEHSMQSLSKNQEQIRDYFQGTLGNLFPFGTTLEQMGKQNMAMFERTMRMFTPFNIPGVGVPGAAGESTATADSTDSSSVTPSSAAPASQPIDFAAAAAASAIAAEEAHEKAEEDAFTPASSMKQEKEKKVVSITPLPMPETSKAAAQNVVIGEDVQSKIAALQRQLSNLAKNKA